ncbi:hypothetical protein K435DRAFT_774996 [Dendrothele bispora CBS 962.96]|uniref:DUF2423 domain-containing protein n=1 Tax=Dendrothele bispora (strain CBS 962.96) TaxID=1314807 RepID=A0A4S8MKF1_DENBC|nr:hypothetical protein K435DRAFT_774996 [Dendrothele bispora CBS 962.96]
MAKSLRSKVKRDFRSKKREAGVYAATEAARLARLNAKLLSTVSKDKKEFAEKEEEDESAMPVEETSPEDSTKPDDSMQLDQSPANNPKSTRISTHGPRGSRREEWRLSKGLSARPASKGMNRQGGIAARRKAGRSKRRR